METVQRRVSPLTVTSLAPNEIFVFGTDAAGRHDGTSSKTALEKFGAKKGVSEGLQGQSYAIPTMSKVQYIAPAVNRFIEYAKQNPKMKFLVTPVGCGTAGFKESEIAPLFAKCVPLTNVYLPLGFWRVLEEAK